jgi:hypothetical protein
MLLSHAFPLTGIVNLPPANIVMTSMVTIITEPSQPRENPAMKTFEGSSEEWIDGRQKVIFKLFILL